MPKAKTKKIFRLVAVFLAVLFTAQSCSLLGGPRDAGPKIELVWWKPFDDARIVAPLVEEFQKANPSIQIRYVQKSIETYEDELLEALASGTGPDIFSLHNDWVPKQKPRIVPAPAGLFSPRELSEQFLQVVNTDLVENGQIYAAPLGVDILSLYYNKDLLASSGIARPPATWEELVNLVPKLTRQDKFGNFERSAIALGTADNVNRATDILSLLFLQNGTQIFDPARSSATFNSESGARALEFYTQFANPAKTTYTWNSRANNSIEGFSSGQVAMILSYSYLRPVLAEKAPFLNYGVAPAPQIDPAAAKVNFANYWAEAVAKQGKNQQAAWQFLRFISLPAVLPKYAEVVKTVSPRVALVEQQIADPEIGVFAENALSARSFYKPDSDAVENIFAQMIGDVILRSIAVPAALSAAAQKMNLLLRMQQ